MRAWIRVEAPLEFEGAHDLVNGHHVLTGGLDVELPMYSAEIITASGCAALLRLHQVALEARRKVSVIGAHGLALTAMRLTALTEVKGGGDRNEVDGCS